MTGSHTRWARPEAESEDPERIAIREALAFGKAVYDRRVALGLSVAELGLRAGMTTAEIECIEEGGAEATIPLLRRLAPPSMPTSASPQATTSGQSASKPTPPDRLPRSSSPCLLLTASGRALIRADAVIVLASAHVGLEAECAGGSGQVGS